MRERERTYLLAFLAIFQRLHSVSKSLKRTFVDKHLCILSLKYKCFLHRIQPNINIKRPKGHLLFCYLHFSFANLYLLLIRHGSNPKFPYSNRIESLFLRSGSDQYQFENLGELTCVNTYMLLCHFYGLKLAGSIGMA